MQRVLQFIVGEKLQSNKAAIWQQSLQSEKCRMTLKGRGTAKEWMTLFESITAHGNTAYPIRTRSRREFFIVIPNFLSYNCA